MELKAIVVDDDASSASAIARLLQESGCTVAVCTAAEEAAARALDEQFDLVSLDLSMPKRDGFEVLRLIRSHEHSRRSPSVPVIAVTGKAAPEDKANTLAAGFAAHLRKPVTLGEVERMLQDVVVLHSQLQHSRYTIDHSAITARVEAMLPATSDGRLQTIAGLTLAVEQQGRDLLRQGLIAAYAGDRPAATGCAESLARLADALGAARLSAICHSLESAWLMGSAAFERDAVLARAELDRVVFTLRERVLL